MPFQSWVESLVAQQVDGTALASSTTATSIIAAAAKFTLQPSFPLIGRTLRFRLTGRISTLVTAPGTMTFEIKAGSTVIWTSGAITLNITAKVNVSWILDVDLTCRAIGNGTSTTFIGVGRFSSEAVIGSVVPATGGSGVLLLPASAPAVGTGIDSTVTNQIDVFGTWSVNSASNSIQVHTYTLEAMN
jgi:hypothetical protein